MQAAYFLSWPVLGSAIILAWQPSPGEMSTMVKDSGLADDKLLQKVRFTPPSSIVVGLMIAS